MTMKLFVNHNGEVLPEFTPIFGMDNRGFRYGDALFETVRIANGKICFLDEHIIRLKKGMKVLKMDIPNNYTTEIFEEEIGKLISKNKITKGGRIRISVYRDSEGLYMPNTNNVKFSIELKPLNNTTYEINEQGLKIDVYEDIRNPVNKLSNLKTNNCLPFILAGIYKKENKLNDCLLLNDSDCITEAISSNVFIIKNGVLYTPSLEVGCVEGIMRQNVIKIARTNGYNVYETILYKKDLIYADEVFLTNSIDGTQWVKSYKDKEYVCNISYKINQAIVNRN